ncbi:MAG: hypothetical protein ACK4TA_09335 [Saprospiraceae bacterium]
MSRRPHPIDDAFRQKLEHHASDTPDYLWEGIVRQRNMHRNVHLRWRERVLLAAALLLFVYASLLTWQLRQMRPNLGYFPIALTPDFDGQNANTSSTNQYLYPEHENVNTATSLPHLSNKTTPIETLSIENQEVISLNEQLSTTLESWTKEGVLTPAAAAVSTFQLSTLPITLYQIRHSNKLSFDPSKCAAFSNQNKLRLYFDVLASPDFTFRNIKATSGDYETYAANRKETEAARYNYSIGARLSAVSNSGLALRAGLNYSEINERFELANENETRIIITYDPLGNIIKTDTITQKIITNNRYQTLDIPVMIGYEIPLKKVTLAINGGAYFNLHFKPEGEFLSPYDNHPVPFSNDENPENNITAFRDKLGVGWYGSVGVHYKISPRLQVLVEPHLRAYPRSFTRDDFMTEQKYLTAGVFVGLRHQFSL